MWLGVLLLSCAGPDEPPIPVAPDRGECVDTWDSFAADSLRTWCTACHSSQLGPGHRYDAPLGIDFDTYATTVVLAPLIVTSATGDDPRMPPVGGPGPEERERLAAWVACGAPGDGPPAPARCTPNVGSHDGDAIVTSDAEAAELCASASTIAGDLQVAASVDLHCLCEVDGAVTVTGSGDVDLGGLTRIGGDLTASAPGLTSLEVSSLAAVGGDVRIVGAALDGVFLSMLASVGGDLVVSDLPIADRVDLSRLVSVGGALVLERLPAFVNLVGEGFTVEEIGGDLVLQDLDAWPGANLFVSLRSVAGEIVVADNDAMSQLNGFQLLVSVDALRVSDNDALLGIAGFDALEALPGDLVVERNATLRTEAGFGALRTVLGGVSIVDNPRLGTFGGLAAVEQVGGLVFAGTEDVSDVLPWALRVVSGDLVLRDHAALTAIDGFPSLETIGGDLEVRRCLALGRLDDFGPVTEIGGSLMLAGNPSLTLLSALTDLRVVGEDLVVTDNLVLFSVMPLRGLDAVGGDVRITDNPALTDEAAQSVVDTIGSIGGTVTVGGNG